MLTIESAKAYVSGLYNNAVITGTQHVPGGVDDTEFVYVYFTLNGEEGRMDVWVEEGKLYGEW